MSTKGTVAFTTWDGELEAAVYVHNAGHFTPETFAEFFAAVSRDCGPAPHDLRFHHPSYLAAKFTVWIAGTASMAFRGVGVITGPGKWHANRRFTVRCHQEASAEPPEVTEELADWERELLDQEASARAVKAAPFAVGDRVRITSRDHPWHGHTGTISAPFESKSAPDLKWTVAVDGWAEAAVSESEIRRAS